MLFIFLITLTYVISSSSGLLVHVHTTEDQACMRDEASESNDERMVCRELKRIINSNIDIMKVRRTE